MKVLWADTGLDCLIADDRSNINFIGRWSDAGAELHYDFARIRAKPFEQNPNGDPGDVTLRSFFSRVDYTAGFVHRVHKVNGAAVCNIDPECHARQIRDQAIAGSRFLRMGFRINHGYVDTMDLVGGFETFAVKSECDGVAGMPVPKAFYDLFPVFLHIQQWMPQRETVAKSWESIKGWE